MIKKGISFWSFPDGTTIAQGIKTSKTAGFEGIELLLVKDGLWGATEGDGIEEAKRVANCEGIEIASVTMGPNWWEGMMTSKRPEPRQRAKDNVKRLIDTAAALNVDTVQVVPGGVEISWIEGITDLMPYDEAYDTALESFVELAPYAEHAGVTIAIENVWNKFLLSPLEMRDFIDKISSPNVGCYFDVGNVMIHGFPEQWIRILGNRIKRVHVKDYKYQPGDINSFCDLLGGDVNWPAVIEALENIDYDSYCIAEMMPVYHYFPDQLIHNTSASLGRIIQKK